MDSTCLFKNFIFVISHPCRSLNLDLNSMEGSILISASAQTIYLTLTSVVLDLFGMSSSLFFPSSLLACRLGHGELVISDTSKIMGWKLISVILYYFSYTFTPKGFTATSPKTKSKYRPACLKVACGQQVEFPAVSSQPQHPSPGLPLLTLQIPHVVRLTSIPFTGRQFLPQ